MKTLLLITAILIAKPMTSAQADTWTWVAISSGSKLNVHLARCNFARPNPLPIFSLIARLQSEPTS